VTIDRSVDCCNLYTRTSKNTDEKAWRGDEQALEIFHKIMRTLIFLSAALLSLIAGSCRLRTPTLPPVSSGSNQFQPPAETGPFTVIGHIEHRFDIYTVKSGDQGIVYSGRDKAGSVLFDNLTAQQLKSQSPVIYDFVEAANAGSAKLIGVPRLPVK